MPTFIDNKAIDYRNFIFRKLRVLMEYWQVLVVLMMALRITWVEWESKDEDFPRRTHININMAPKCGGIFIFMTRNKVSVLLRPVLETISLNSKTEVDLMSSVWVADGNSHDSVPFRYMQMQNVSNCELRWSQR